MEAKRFKVLVVTHTESLCSQRVLTGITDGIAEAGSVEVRILKSSAAFTTENVRRALKGGVNGIIVSHPYNGEPSDLLFKSGLPIVTVHPLDAVLARHSPNLYAVMSDAEAIGLRATQFFMSQRRFCSYAYVGARGAPDWSVRRGQAYVRALLAQGEDCRCYESHKLAFDRRQLADFIRSLRRPAAVFAANDERAIEILDVCRHLDIKIPEEISLLGVDNDSFLCDCCEPSLSSVTPDFEREGFTAARELDRLLRHPNLAARTARRIAATGVVVRSSTRPGYSAETLVQSCTDFIRRNFGKKLSVQAVSRAMGVSRRLAEMRFRQVRGVSIGAFIAATRIKHAQHLLKTSKMPLSEIARDSGFSNASYFTQSFKRLTGVTPRNWTNKSCVFVRNAKKDDVFLPQSV